MKTSLLIQIILVLALFSNAQIVNIPDAVFKEALVNDTLINTNLDNEIQLSEAIAFNDTINVSCKLIYDLTGIEAFTSLIGFNLFPMFRSLHLSW